MNRMMMSAAVLVAVMVGPAFGATGSAVQVDMKVKVFVSPEQIGPLARQVLEFYDVTPEYFVGAVSSNTYDRLVGQGYRVEVLVADMQQEASKYDAEFHTYQQIMDTWAIVAADNPGICRLDTIGTSAGGNLLIAMRVTDNPNSWEPEPRLCFDGMAHGNENNGTEIVHFALVELVSGYGSDPDITRWVNDREIWLLPWLNPDGLISRRRTNNNGVDLNRNYGYSWDGGGPGVFSETEIQAVFHLGRKYPMTAWTQFHSGTESAMWPWGYTTLATRDSVVHAYEMTRYGQICNYPAFQISRELYPVNGGSTDWYYGVTGALGYAPEVCFGQPSPPSEIDTISRKNWTAMKEMIERAMWGVRGRVRDSVSGNPLAARVTVDPPEWLAYTDSVGFFHKNVHAGTYSVTAYANGYVPKTVTGVVVPADTFAWVDLALAPDTTAPATALWSLTNQIEETPSNTNTTNAWWALGERDGRFFSIGKDGWASFDVGERTPIVNGPGSDFFVVEGDDGEAEACSVFASTEWNGPWTYLGFGTGTQGYDLADGGMPVARYVRIADDDVGGGSGQYAGFDIDAIEAVVVNAPAVVYVSKTVIDSPPGGNGDGRLDAGEAAELVLTLKNMGRVGVDSVTAVLRTDDSLVVVRDTSGYFGDLEPDSVRSNYEDRFGITADAATPKEHVAEMVLHLTGTDWQDSVRFTLTVGEYLVTDPIPDGPRTPPLYWAYDDVDTGYAETPEYEWVEINATGTQIVFQQNDDVVGVDLPSEFGTFRFYGQEYTRLSVSADGWICPGVYTQRHYSNRGLPSPENPPGMLCLNWDDLYPSYSGQGHVYYEHDSANHRFIVEYDSVAYYNLRAMRDKYEVIIYDSTLAGPSGDNVVVMQYMTANYFGSSTVGIQDPTRAIAIQVLLNGDWTRGAAPIEPGRAVKYTTVDPTGVAEGMLLPQAERLAVVPLGNPFQDMTSIRYSVHRTGPVDLAVFDGAGRLVRNLVSGHCTPGTYRVTWDGADNAGRSMASGVYWLLLTDELETASAKTVKMR